MTAPWMKFYPSDWQSDPMLRCCSIAARGLWVEMMCLMHKAEQYGSLLINGARVDKRKLAILVGISEKECCALLLELEGSGVFSRDGDGTIYSRRMRRDHIRSEEGRKQIGKRWGGPNRVPNRSDDETNNRVPTPDPITQKLEARSQSLETDSEANASGADAPPDPSIAEREFFARGKQILGKSAGGQLAKLKAAKGGNVALARAALEAASQAQNPSEYIAGVIRAGPSTAKPLTEFQRKQQETNDVRQMLRDSATATRSGGTADRVLSVDYGERSEGLCSGTGQPVLALSSTLGPRGH